MSKRTTSDDAPIGCFLLQFICFSTREMDVYLIPRADLSLREIELIELAGSADYTTSDEWNSDSRTNAHIIVAFLAVYGAIISSRVNYQDFFGIIRDTDVPAEDSDLFEELWNRAEAEIKMGSWLKYNAPHHDGIPRGHVVERFVVITQPQK